MLSIFLLIISKTASVIYSCVKPTAFASWFIVLHH